ncbi:hypothetical protein, partial [uncultured Duncaniella sp.]|uniref:hypothetical protein n=1 Tax=uncultured Duncaniella sp. TaxID=2768039 RepID=UPI002674CE3D
VLTEKYAKNKKIPRFRNTTICILVCLTQKKEQNVCKHRFFLIILQYRLKISFHSVKAKNRYHKNLFLKKANRRESSKLITNKPINLKSLVITNYGSSKA